MFRRALPLIALLLFAAHGAGVRAQESQKTEDRQKPVATQTPQATPAPAATPGQVAAQQKPSAARYKELVEKLRKGERDVDFTELRMSFTETEDFSPYGGDRDARGAMFGALNAGKWDEALKQSSKILEKNYVDINAHFGAYIANTRKGDTAKADFHKFVTLGLVNSVRGAGDGKSMEQAFVVISTDEEYALLNILGLLPGDQSLMHGGGHAYDKLDAVDPKTNQEHEFYFQIDIPFGWLGRTIKGAGEGKKP
jgi:hypothetical protein